MNEEVFTYLHFAAKLTVLCGYSLYFVKCHIGIMEILYFKRKAGNY